MSEPLASWRFNTPSKTDDTKADSFMTVPTLVHWGRKYGNADDDRQGFLHTTVIGEYHLSPVKTKSGMHVGYHLMFANNGKGSTKTEGMWTDLGLFTHPGNAVARAKSHFDKHSVGVKLTESVNKCCKKGAAGLKGKKKKNGKKGKADKDDGKNGSGMWFGKDAANQKEESVFVKVAKMLTRRAASGLASD